MCVCLLERERVLEDKKDRERVCVWVGVCASVCVCAFMKEREIVHIREGRHKDNCEKERESSRERN